MIADDGLAGSSLNGLPPETQGTLSRRQFFEWVFGKSSGYVCISRKRLRRPDESEEEYKRANNWHDENFPWPDGIDGVLSYLDLWDGKQELYYRAQLFDGSGKHTKANVTAAPVAFADLDDCLPDRLLIPPTVLVESSPGRHQGLWRLVEGTTPEQAEGISKRIAHHHKPDGADGGGWDLTQALRVPCSENLKPERQLPDGSAPVVRVVAWNDATYPPEAFDVYPPLAADSPTGAQDAPIPDTLPTDSAEELLARDSVSERARELFSTEPGGEWSGPLWSLESLLREAGLTPEETFIVCRQAECNKYERDGRGDLPLWNEIVKNFAQAAQKPEQPTGRLRRVSLGKLAREGIEPPVLIAAGLFYQGMAHTIAGPPESGKTTLACWALIDELRRGGSVIVLDEESGEEQFAERMLALGATPEELDRIHYFPFPGMQWNKEDGAEFKTLLDDVRPTMVLFDSQGAMLAIASLDEDKSKEVGPFWNNVLLPICRTHGATLLVIDHVPKGDSTQYARGSGAKLQYTDVNYKAKAVTPFTREQAGVIELTASKDRRGWLRRKRVLTVIPDGSGGMRITVQEHDADGTDIEVPTELRIIQTVTNHPLELTKQQLQKRVGGKRETTLAVIDRLSQDGVIRPVVVKREEGNRRVGREVFELGDSPGRVNE
jgi:hypothetical protein